MTRPRLSFITCVLLACMGCTGDRGHDAATDDLTTDGSSGADSSSTETATGSGSSTTEAVGSTSTADGTTSEPEEIDYEGEHVVLITDSPDDPCGGTMAHMDRLIKRLAERLAVLPPVLDERIQFIWMHDPADVEELCGFSESVAGCANGNRIYSRSLPLNHELVHSVSFAAGYPPPFFTEGLAAAYSGYNAWPVPEHVFSSSEEDILALLTRSSLEIAGTPGGYEGAARFTAYLVDQYGMDAYLELYSLLPRDSHLETIDQLFQETFGVSLAESVEGFGPPWTDNQTNIDPQLSECAAREVSWDGEVINMSGAVLCTNDTAIGPYDLGRVEQQYTIEVPADGLYELRIEGNEAEAELGQDFFDFDFDPPFIGVSLVPCAVGAPGFMETSVNGTPRIGQLKAGRHSLRLLGSLTTPWPFRFTLKRLPDP